MGSFYLGDYAFFLKRSYGLCTDLHCYLLAVDNYGFLLEVWLPYLFGVALREADIAAVLLAFASDFTLLHVIDPFIAVTYLERNIQGQSIAVFKPYVKG